jgi:hypothetical protein
VEYSAVVGLSMGCYDCALAKVIFFAAVYQMDASHIFGQWELARLTNLPEGTPAQGNTRTSLSDLSI